MTDWYDNCVSLHDKREGWLQGLVLAYGIFSPLRTFLVVLRTQIGPETSVDVVVATARSSELQIKLPRLPLVIVDRSAGGCRKLPKCRQTLVSYQRCRHVQKHSNQTTSTRPGIASERSESQRPINPS
ncbi:hypothetical protein NEUTE1DRAFT_101807 [Neurospora tetrasperma FGSC 2508]|uniref:Uncharacterized protein n=1 Tax=Neurospora tetrasperma (strain FGSC 2508 / ATCC MYA-4615 / P0657) TaxID=510951 RepID=F8MQ97_NEUT8|nr:uncharacterized protein NEUTE1DRAFT_101807 [Neurospora tetrasperma FGSC 2508]EGO56527.1 hypothetical protein NEUTE1DRAFT_101807 [Neurospora tetrasperma FGSC 2508]